MTCCLLAGLLMTCQSLSYADVVSELVMVRDGVLAFTDSHFLLSLLSLSSDVSPLFSFFDVL